MYVDEIQTRRRSPMAEQSRFDMRALQRRLEQRVVKEVNLADRQVVRSPPVSVHLSKQLRGKWSFVAGLTWSPATLSGRFISVRHDCRPFPFQSPTSGRPFLRSLIPHLWE